MPTARQTNGRTEIICESALEFVSVLDPLTGAFPNPPGRPTYVFRGVSSELHELLPAAYRSSSKLRSRDSWLQPPLSTIAAQCQAELATLRRFFDVAAGHGVRLPEDSQALRSKLDEWDTKIYLAAQDALTAGDVPMLWPPSEFLSLIALAQHYGIPTRALDWSSSPLVAAYFGARGAIAATTPGFIAVWVFSYFTREFDRILQTIYPDERPLLLYTAPGADNDNLRAQRGLFMLEVHRIVDPKLPFQPRPYDILLPDTVPSMRNIYPLVHRVLVPSQHAAGVLHYLASAGVSGGSVFPGLWGVAREIEEDQWLAEFKPAIELSPLAQQIQAEMSARRNRSGA